MDILNKYHLYNLYNIITAHHFCAVELDTCRHPALSLILLLLILFVCLVSLLYLLHLTDNHFSCRPSNFSVSADPPFSSDINQLSYYLYTSVKCKIFGLRWPSSLAQSCFMVVLMFYTLTVSSACHTVSWSAHKCSHSPWLTYCFLFTRAMASLLASWA